MARKPTKPGKDDKPDKTASPRAEGPPPPPEYGDNGHAVECGTAAFLAERYGVTRETLQRWLEAGWLGARSLGSGPSVYRLADVETAIARDKAAAAAEGKTHDQPEAQGHN